MSTDVSKGNTSEAQPRDGKKGIAGRSASSPVFDRSRAGTASVIEEIASSKTSILTMIRANKSHQLAREIQEITQLPQKTLANDVFEVSEKTFSKYKTSEGNFSDHTAELIVKLKELYKKGKLLFGDVAEFNNWLKEPAYGLGDIIPKEIMNTVTGIDLIMEELVRIEFGATA
ncbi:MAG: antitoxin Xre/MbcA/ParS toxin-binding domain-containing protein [Mangrovibacterium sp.]